jgi:hypothetical protein
VRVVYDIDEMYSENHNTISLSLYTNPDAEYQPDPKEYRRYTATINSLSKAENGVIEYYPPTAFGYIIRFTNGTLINRFPILTNAVPEGVSPMSKLETGTAVYNGSNNLTIKNNTITTRYALPQEVGIVYKTSDSESVRNPGSDSSGWIRKSAYVDLGVNESEIFNVSIPLVDGVEYTYYAAYVKTSNGYWYGDVKKFANNVKGDEGGYSIIGVETECLGDSSVLFKLEMDYSKGMPIDLDYVDISGFGTYKLSDLNAKMYGNKVYFVLENLNPMGNYTISLKLKSIYELKSNTVETVFDMRNSEVFSLVNKNINGSRTYYTISPKNSSEKFVFLNVFTQYDDLIPALTDSNLSVVNNENLSNREIILEYTYYGEGIHQSGISWTFRKTIKLY